MKKNQFLAFPALALNCVFACAMFAACDPADDTTDPGDDDTTVVQPGGDDGQGGGEGGEVTSDPHVFTFEAEHTDLTAIQGAGKSNALEGTAVITYDKFDAGASGDYFVGYLYIRNNVVTFNIHSDRDVDDVKFVLRATTEAGVSSIDSDDMLISVNGENISYRTLNFNGVKNGFFSMDSDGLREFSDYTISTGISLHEGDNTNSYSIVSTEPVDGTATARAPILDCIKLTTPEDSEAELTMEPNAMSLLRIEQLENE